MFPVQILDTVMASRLGKHENKWCATHKLSSLTSRYVRRKVVFVGSLSLSFFFTIGRSVTQVSVMSAHFNKSHTGEQK